MKKVSTYIPNEITTSCNESTFTMALAIREKIPIGAYLKENNSEDAMVFIYLSIIKMLPISLFSLSIIISSHSFSCNHMFIIMPPSIIKHCII